MTSVQIHLYGVNQLNFDEENEKIGENKMSEAATCECEFTDRVLVVSTRRLVVDMSTP